MHRSPAAAAVQPSMDGSFVLVPEETEAQHSVPVNNGGGWWSILAGWWRPEVDTNKDDLWRDWEYIQSTAETWAGEQGRRELAQASSTTALAGKLQQMRPLFVQSAQAAFASLSPAEAEELRSSPLASDKRAAIIAELVRRVEQRWLLRFLARFYAGALPEARASFQGSFFEMPYAKNIIGAVKETAWRASHGPSASVGLTEAVLADITWSVWRSLASGLRECLKRLLSESELRFIASEALQLQLPLVLLWRTTPATSRLGTQRAGTGLAKARAVDDQRRAEVKARPVSAKYAPPPKPGPTERCANVAQLRAFLATALPPPPSVSP